MYLEYLIIKDNFNDEIAKYTYEYVVTIEIQNIANQEENAKHLSDIDAEFSGKFRSTLLRNDASAYYNQKLFPLVNEFERQLRRFLYIKNALHTGDKVKKNIENLEIKDFGEIYQLLFVDDDFCKDFKSKINRNNFSKRELLKELDGFKEITTWDKIVGVNNLSIIKENFLDIKDYRNGVMHARNITYADFKRQKSLFNEAIKELDKAINALNRDPVNKEHTEFAVESLYDGMKETLNGIQEALNAIAVQILYNRLNQYSPFFNSNEADSTETTNSNEIISVETTEVR